MLPTYLVLCCLYLVGHILPTLRSRVAYALPYWSCITYLVGGHMLPTLLVTCYLPCWSHFAYLFGTHVAYHIGHVLAYLRLTAWRASSPHIFILRSLNNIHYLFWKFSFLLFLELMNIWKILFITDHRSRRVISNLFSLLLHHNLSHFSNYIMPEFFNLFF